jgi:putative tricarboxylic transport membrane protein
VESFQLLMSGFATALQPGNLFVAFLGCIFGTMVGVLPGIGPAGGTAILIPMTFSLDPTAAIIMLAAIYYGSMYGGTITSVLINTPGEAASAVTCLEGYEMAKRGRAGAALAISAIGSFIGGTIGTFGLVLLALPLTALALTFGPPERFCLVVMGLSLVVGLAGKSVIYGLISALLGLLIAMVGVDPVTGAPRFTFRQAELLDGVNVVPVVMGLFGVGEILSNAENPARRVIQAKAGSLILSLEDIKRSIGPILRGTGIGFFLGLIPGLGAVVASFVSYIAEKRLSKTPEEFGKGMIEGVAGPETANNAFVSGGLVPLFTLGLPSSAVMAILLGAFIMNGLTPGPLLFAEHGDLVWGVIASLYIGNTILLVLNLPLIPLWVSILRIPYSILFTLILAFCVVGAYSLDNSVFDVGIMLGFGILGYCFKKVDFPVAPLVLTIVLGKMMERGLRQSLEISGGDFSIFITRPVSAAFLAITALLFIYPIISAVRRAKASSSTR